MGAGSGGPVNVWTGDPIPLAGGRRWWEQHYIGQPVEKIRKRRKRKYKPKGNNTESYSVLL